MEDPGRAPVDAGTHARHAVSGGPGLPPAAAAALTEAGLCVVNDPQVLAGYGVDWTGRWSGTALGMVRPRCTADVASVLAIAGRSGLPVQIQGGNTGLVGGSVPDRPALLLLTTGLDHLGAVDELDRSVVVGAGVTAAALAAHAEAADLQFGVDLASRDSATIGGMVATNAGGIGVVAYGMMRDQVRGLTAVLADGRVIRHMGRPRKDNAGMDVAGLFIGSEGTLGVITEVELALHPARGQTSVAMLAVDDLAEAVTMARGVGSEATVVAAEVVDAAGVSLAARTLAVADPLPPGAPWLVLLEVADGATGAGFGRWGDRVVALAVTAQDRRRLWAVRECQAEVRSAAWGTDVQRVDVSLRLGCLDEAVAAIRALVAGARRGSATGVPGEQLPTVGFFGHVLDGNLHVHLGGGAPELADSILEVVAGLGGSISAEHGIGRQKVAQLHLARSTEEIAWMRDMKSWADPDGLLNPGVLYP